MKRDKFKFASEADLCTTFMVWARQNRFVCYPETCGWDILLVDPNGIQTGIQAKLRLSAHVIAQASPTLYDWSDTGPTHRAILVPETGELEFVCHRLGITVLHPRRYQPSSWCREPGPHPMEFEQIPSNQFDWHPAKQHDLPEHVPDVAAGVPSPIQLTKWKIAALKVYALLERQGFITRKQIMQHGIDAGRWCQYWLDKHEVKGQWVRGKACPRFDLEHPKVYASILEKTI